MLLGFWKKRSLMEVGKRQWAHRRGLAPSVISVLSILNSGMAEPLPILAYCSLLSGNPSLLPFQAGHLSVPTSIPNISCLRVAGCQHCNADLSQLLQSPKKQWLAKVTKSVRLQNVNKDSLN
jgi:hypothetical protein